MKTKTFQFPIVLAGFLLTGAALADEIESSEPAPLGFLHAPAARASSGHELVIAGVFSPEGIAASAELRYRTIGEQEWSSSPFALERDGRHRAVIPAERMRRPGIEYYVTTSAEESDDAAYVFASAAAPQVVFVLEPSRGETYEARLARHDGRINRVDLEYGYCDFGDNVLPPTEQGEVSRRTRGGNTMHDFTLGYSYRFLTALYAIRVELMGIGHRIDDFNIFGAAEEASGMYSISPSAEFELATYFGGTISMRLAISEQGFEGGGGGSVRIGRIDGTRLDLGLEGVSHAGWRFFFRFEWDTVPYVPMGITVERTQWYAAKSYAVEDWGNRMYYQARLQLPAGFELQGRIGYAGRDEAARGGIVAGGALAYDF